MVIVIDDFAVDSNTVQPKAKPAVPPVTPLYDDNTMYNATVYPDKQVSAPSAAEQPVAYQAPIWESATQTYRDPESGLLWLDDGTPGGQWVSDAAYAAKKAHPAPMPDTNDLGQPPTDNYVYEAMVREMAGAGMIEPPPDLGDYYMGDYYNLPFESRQHWNNKQLDRLGPYYTDAAKTAFQRTPEYVGSGVSLNPPSVPERDFERYGGAYYQDTGKVAFAEPFQDPARGSDVFAHERAHQWDYGQNAETRAAFTQAAMTALSDPSVPEWVRNAIFAGSNGGRDITPEAYAILADATVGRLYELPPYLRRFFDTLYTR